MRRSDLIAGFLIGVGLVIWAWFWSTHGFYCPDGTHAVQQGAWPFHHMVCPP